MSYYTKLIIASALVLAFTIFAAMWNGGAIAEAIMMLLALVLWPLVIFCAPVGLICAAILLTKILTR